MEKIFRQIESFKNIQMDTVLFEGRYPILFTCTDEERVFLFICCLVSAQKVKWIGTETDYDRLIALLENKVTIRETFLEGKKGKYIIQFDGTTTDFEMVDRYQIPEQLLPTAGEYMDAEEGEYSEEIAAFKQRKKRSTVRIKPRRSIYRAFSFKKEKIVLTEEDFPVMPEKERAIFMIRTIRDMNIVQV